MNFPSFHQASDPASRASDPHLDAQLNAFPISAPQSEARRLNLTAAPQLRHLDEFNSQDILLKQYNWAVRLLHDSEYDETIGLNQKVQALNSITTVIQAITKQQTDIYNAERLKALEDALVSCLKQLPEPYKTDFLSAYEVALGKL